MIDGVHLNLGQVVGKIHVLVYDLLVNCVLDAPIQTGQFEDACDTSEVKVEVRLLQEIYLNATNNRNESDEGFHHNADLGLEFYI